MATGRWLTKFQAVWDPKYNDFFACGSLQHPRQLEGYCAVSGSEGTKQSGKNAGKKRSSPRKSMTVKKEDGTVEEDEGALANDSFFAAKILYSV